MTAGVKEVHAGLCDVLSDFQLICLFAVRFCVEWQCISLGQRLILVADLSRLFLLPAKVVATAMSEVARIQSTRLPKVGLLHHWVALAIARA